MNFVSIFNDVLGPVMRGPSSSHTAGAYRMGRIARSLFGEEPASVTCTFDPRGSYAPTYLITGADLAFTVGIMEWAITDARYFEALELANKQGIKINFCVSEIENADHPNTVRIQMRSRSEKKLLLLAKSTGGGGVVFTRIDKWPVEIMAKSYEFLIQTGTDTESRMCELLNSDGYVIDQPVRRKLGDEVLLHFKRTFPLASEVQVRIDRFPGVREFRMVSPLFYVKRGEELFSNTEEMTAAAENRNCSLGKIAMAYEAKLLGLSEKEILDEMLRRFEVMRISVNEGLHDRNVKMHLLKPSARRIFDSVGEGLAAIGGIHTRAAARSMAVMHICNSKGIICAAPTGGSAGVLPGVLVTLVEEKNIGPEKTAMALFAASAIGLIIAQRATFAAEVAGCQVEIGAAGAMSAAAVVEVAGGKARQAVDAAAIALQNTMGSVCDPVQGGCEIPCHTRNAVASSSAFVCADLILGGYYNPIPFDEVVDASYAVGKTLPGELRCTALGGIAAAPSALAMSHLK